jgi:hypothetical protein
LGDDRRLHLDHRPTIAEGVDEGFSFWDWLVIAVGAVFILQALSSA